MSYPVLGRLRRGGGWVHSGVWLMGWLANGGKVWWLSRLGVRGILKIGDTRDMEFEDSRSASQRNKIGSR
ncbi:hypothetical protein Pyn_38149 [Prunus yedoensis var. nudiflora]|uniref:Uncharacterized protein n=1 Tax=Prunus yedoensis var. nudiflora TaxID=2094558 RepID=A0A314ZSV5_PRUYE|nr:hypothetical protein Pyn_38149 [Prunus yedoensis var. nudiflora]